MGALVPTVTPYYIYTYAQRYKKGVELKQLYIFLSEVVRITLKEKI